MKYFQQVGKYFLGESSGIISWEYFTALQSAAIEWRAFGVKRKISAAQSHKNVSIRR